MSYIEDTCMILGLPLLLAFLMICFHYNWYKLMAGGLVALGISVMLYFSLSVYEIKKETDGIHVCRKCDFSHANEQIGDSISTFTICNVINKYEDKKYYQPYAIIHILHLKNGNEAVYSRRRCLIKESSFVQIRQFTDTTGYVVDLLQYVEECGDTLYLDTYMNEKVANPENFRIPSYYIDPTVYFY